MDGGKLIHHYSSRLHSIYDLLRRGHPNSESPTNVKKYHECLMLIDLYIQELRIISEAILFIDDSDQVSAAFVEKNVELPPE